jgi:hypothetical protein
MEPKQIARFLTEDIRTNNGNTLTDQTCLKCSRRLNAHVALNDNDQGPTPGDMSICLYCNHASVYNDDLSLREPTPEEVKGVKIPLSVFQAL